MSIELFVVIVALAFIVTAVFCTGLWFVLHLILKDAAKLNLTGYQNLLGDDEDEVDLPGHFASSPVGFPPSLGRE